MHAGSQIQLLRRPLKFHWIAGCLNADGQRVGSRSVKGPTAGTPGLRPFNTARIPNGFYVSYVSRPDVAFLSREIYEDLLYFKHGIKLEEGDTVIDVGGNIGMFANHCAELVGPQGRVICAEPIPQVFTVLEDNIIRHHRWCVERGLPSALPEALNCGIGSCDGDEVEFTFYGSAAGWSTMYENAMEVEDAMGVFLEHSIGQGQGVEPSLVASMGRRLRRWTPQPVWNLAWRIMSDMALSHVSLLKIDAERAEVDVLKGLSAEAMAGIQQVVMEVHRVGDNVEVALGLLHSAGFLKCIVDQDEHLGGSTIFNIYARR